MMAGEYAQVSGATYEASFAESGPVRLFAQPTVNSPVGFELDRWGRLTRLVERNEVSRLFRVETTARWRGWRILVERVLDDGRRADIYVDGYDQRPPTGQPPRAEDAIWVTDRTPPHDLGLRQVENNVWRGTVPIDELVDVREVFVEIPV
ncbi:hypothetical protein [Cellulomonas fimi]|uniref:Uncharacterized protein n=1 Tax=Cellulomonas fimi TaxID=1708 RepID=A0A7Y0QG74_CELFI|nr:hypothetical protein [Cellulomonas fimi]NMR19816.1 hypothetical protein [Cellulomonas fimi]